MYFLEIQRASPNAADPQTQGSRLRPEVLRLRLMPRRGSGEAGRGREGGREGGGEEAGRRLGAGWEQAGSRLGAGWEQAGSRLGAGWEEAGGLKVCIFSAQRAAIIARFQGRLLSQAAASEHPVRQGMHAGRRPQRMHFFGPAGSEYRQILGVISVRSCCI